MICVPITPAYKCLWGTPKTKCAEEFICKQRMGPSMKMRISLFCYEHLKNDLNCTNNAISPNIKDYAPRWACEDHLNCSHCRNIQWLVKHNSWGGLDGWRCKDQGPTGLQTVHKELHITGDHSQVIFSHSDGIRKRSILSCEWWALRRTGCIWKKPQQHL